MVEAIQIIKHRINSIIEITVDKDVDAWFGVTPPSKSLRRRTALKALGKAWTWFREEHRATPHRIALKTGQIFKLNEDKKIQFQETRFRGYDNEDGSPKNPFEDMSFLEAHLQFQNRNRKRRTDQAARKRKKEDKAKDEKNKKRKKKEKDKEKNQKRKKRKKRRKKIIVKDESKSPIRLEPVKLEPIPVPLLLPPVIKKEKRNIQLEVFEDKRVCIEDFLKNL